MISRPTPSPSDAVVALVELAPTDARNLEREAADAVDRAARQLGWHHHERGPFGNVIERGQRVLIKPNFVLHANKGPWGIEPLVTNPALIRAITQAALQAGADEVLVGDAPIQGCRLEELLDQTGLSAWADELMRCEPRFKGIRDFRRTTSVVVNGVRRASENLVAEDRFVLYDLGRDSLLEPVTDTRAGFRVTRYDPRLMAKTHAPGRHQYLVAREVIEADVIINVPKLKTHSKAGVTCALKNLVGINGNKEFLPHHRIGGSTAGGDCYPGTNPVKRSLEFLYDKQNSIRSYAAGRLLHWLGLPLGVMLRASNDRIGVEGSWSGNDTIWRTCLDLNRILRYGRADATLSDAPQRRVLHVPDAIVAGQGEGPLAPEPLPMGLILAGSNPAAVDYLAATLLGYDPEKIPLVRNAFGEFRWPISSVSRDDVRVVGDWGTGSPRMIVDSGNRRLHITLPAGWEDCAEQPTGPLGTVTA